jgi:hypothetical protein
VGSAETRRRAEPPRSTDGAVSADLGGEDGGEVTAVTGGLLVPVEAPPIVGGTMLIVGGRITAIGGADVDVPAGGPG